MSRVQFLRNSRATYAVKLVEFFHIFRHDRNCLVCFFEGEDAKYYSTRISIICGSNWAGLECGGKDDVVRLWAFISHHGVYRKAKTAFFIDRDYDETISPEMAKRVYETPCYSIENLYTSLDVVKRVFEAEFKISYASVEDTTIEDCLRLYSDIQTQFHAAIAELNAWLMIQRTYFTQSGRLDGNRVLNLSNVGLDELVKVQITSVTKMYELARLNVLFPNSHPVSEQEVRRKLSEIDMSASRRIFRGKYEIEFLRTILAKLKTDRCSKNRTFFKKKGRVKMLLSRENIISELSQYAETPESLKEYLSGIQQQFCAAVPA
ncbi:MAG: DUF4435 domain-containing protein [Syntrophobacteraceae bacterium]